MYYEPVDLGPVILLLFMFHTFSGLPQTQRHSILQALFTGHYLMQEGFLTLNYALRVECCNSEESRVLRSLIASSYRVKNQNLQSYFQYKLTYKHQTKSLESDTTSNYMVLAMTWVSLMLIRLKMALQHQKRQRVADLLFAKMKVKSISDMLGCHLRLCIASRKP